MSTHTPMPAFIQPPQPVTGLSEAGFSNAVVSFDATVYQPGDEQGLGVVLPDSLGRAVAKRQAEFIAGRYCAMQALRRAGLPVQQPAINPDRSPQWPAGVYGSISHSSGVAVAAVSQQQYIGLDLETRMRDKTAASVASRILTQDEQQRFGTDSAVDPDLLTQIFSLKESFYKAAYPQVQCFFGFEAVSVLQLDAKAGLIEFRLEQGLSPALQQGRVLQGRLCELPGQQWLSWVELPL